MKNKIFTIVCIFLLIMSVFFTNVKASNSYVTCNGKTYKLPEECSNNYIIFEYDNKVWLYWSDSTYWGVHQGYDYYDLFSYSNDSSYGTDDNRVSCHQYAISVDSIDFSNPIEKYERTWGYCCGSNFADIKIYFSSVDVHDVSGKIFFQAPPQEAPLTPIEILMVEAQQITQTTLVVIAVVVGLLICVIGLRKGFQTLVNGLRI